MKKIFISFLFFMSVIMFSFASSSVRFVEELNVQKAKNELSKTSSLSEQLVSRGVGQVASLWTPADGTTKEFVDFCVNNFCKNKEEKEKLFYRICNNFESILGHNNRVTVDLLRPLHVTGYENLSIDELFGSYNGLSHFADDMFESKIAFIIILNFPSFTLEEKIANGADWSALEWGYVRLGDVFTSRVPAKIQQSINNATSAADNYISNYNIYMGQVWSDNNEKFWSKDLKLISHWGLRDELKSCYSDKEKGLEKQKIIYNIMKRIIDQTIPLDVINNDEYIWYPSSNQTFMGNVEISGNSEKNTRYQYLLNNFKAVKEEDAYYEGQKDFIARKFEGEYEISVKEVEKLFTQLLSSSEVKIVADLISKRLGRKLQPFDIWYDGFKSRSGVTSEELDKLTTAKYPNKDAFVNDLPVILSKLGFTDEKAKFICSHVTVDPSVGAGHAWESMMKSDNALLRTRIGSNGMDYKGYNIGVHEFGHNVEQTISLHDVPNYFLRGVPNTAFTEALAFTFQARDLQLLNGNIPDEYDEYFKTLDIFWDCYEIMGVSLVDIKVWQWMYNNPNTTAEALKNAVLDIAKQVWNRYYAPIFKIEDQTILAVYSHMIDSPLYLSAYPIGHLIDFQLENYLKDKVIGTEVERIFALGHLTPDLWMQRAVGKSISVNPLLQQVSNSVIKISECDKIQQDNAKKTKKSKK